MAYAAGAVLSTPIYRDWTSILSSYVGTQADKTAQSVEVLVGLIQDMPQYPDRMLGVKNYLKNGSEVEAEDKFSFLIDSYNWNEMGYDGNPLDHKLPLYNQLNFEDVIEVYQKMNKNKKYAIGIVGKLSDIDQNNLKSQGKIVKVNKNSLFSE
ncbi:MAG: hypothetical protein O2878_07210 [Bacteroidetes bacterium]|nr:hypothetical protein [Bacteroidota bacterium]